MRTVGRGTAGLALLAAVVCGACPAFAATFTVTSTTDAVDAAPGNGQCAAADGACTLRAAVQESNALPGADTIVVPTGTYPLTVATEGADDGAQEGDLDVTDDLTIARGGTGEGPAVIGGHAAGRLFEVGGGAAVTLRDVTVTGGQQANADAACGSAGGGICVVGASVVLAGVTVSGNAARGGGGVVVRNGMLALREATQVDGNTADGDAALDCATLEADPCAGGGGGVCAAGSVLSLEQVRITGNRARDGGGVKASGGAVTVVDTAFEGNLATVTADAGVGGAVAVDGASLEVVRTTASGGNRANADGGAFYLCAPASVWMANVTMSDNRAARGAGMFVAAGCTAAPCRLNNVTIARNTGPGWETGDVIGTLPALANSLLVGNEPSDCAGRLASGGCTLVRRNACAVVSGAVAQTDAAVNDVVDVLADNGGTTETHALPTLSPARDPLDLVGCSEPRETACEATDQRGATRDFCTCDLGAYEAGQPGNCRLDSGATPDGDGVEARCDCCPGTSADGTASVFTDRYGCAVDQTCPCGPRGCLRSCLKQASKGLVLPAPPTKKERQRLVRRTLASAPKRCGVPRRDDRDRDGILNADDNCRQRCNPGQQDGDGDGVGDRCDNCVRVPNAGQGDRDLDGYGTVCDLCPDVASANNGDRDGDGIGDVCDNCDRTPNGGQEDADKDWVGDACDDCPDTEAGVKVEHDLAGCRGCSVAQGCPGVPVSTTVPDDAETTTTTTTSTTTTTTG